MRMANKNNVHCLHFKHKNDDKSGKRQGGVEGV